VASAASIVVREAVGALAVVVDSAVLVGVGTVETSVVLVGEEPGGVVALADLVAGSVDFAVAGSGGRNTDKREIRKTKSKTISNHKKNGFQVEVTPKADRVQAVSARIVSFISTVQKNFDGAKKRRQL
jgi:hypothetical protein